jgi:amidase
MSSSRHCAGRLRLGLTKARRVGALRSLRASNSSAWLVPWNVTGQPAVAIPIASDDDNLPTAIQLAGRAHDETTLLTLASQIEAAHPFPRWSPTATLTPD